MAKELSEETKVTLDLKTLGAIGRRYSNACWYVVCFAG